MRRLADSLLRRRAAGYLTNDPMATLVTSTWGAALGNERVDSATFQSYAVNGYAGNGIVFAVITDRMLLFAEAVPAILDLTTGRTKPLDPRTSILEHPWPNAGAGELLSRMEQDVSLAGNFYALRRDDRLVRLRPDYVEMVVLPDEEGHPRVEGYLFSPDGVIGQDSVLYGVEEVCHYSPIPDPLKHYRGMSWLTPVVREVNADIAMTSHKIAFFENSATPNLLIKYQQKLSPETLANLSARFAARHQGPEKAWKTAVLDEGADLTVVGHSMEQMTFTALQAAGENRIAAAGGVPGIYAGLKEGLDAATYSNYQQAVRRFADGTMRPLWRSAAAALSKFIDLGENERLVLDATNVEALRQGETERAETQRVQAITIGELIRSGFVPESAMKAVALDDLSVLEHTGGVPTALYPEGKDPSKVASKESPNAQGAKGDGMS